MAKKVKPPKLPVAAPNPSNRFPLSARCPLAGHSASGDCSRGAAVWLCIDYPTKYLMPVTISMPSITSFIIVQGEQIFMPQESVGQAFPASVRDGFSDAYVITFSIIVQGYRVAVCPF